MKTLRLSIDPENLESESSRAALKTAASILLGGGLVAFPTETVYGLGANALDAAAVEKIFLAKQRPSWDPLIVHISDLAMLSTVSSQITQAANDLISAFWPGPLTLLLPKAEAVPSIVTAGRPLVGVRMPAHPVAHALIAALGFPIAAPSANSFGRISPTRAAHVLEDLDGRIDAVIDAGETAHGLESSVVDASREPVTIYRPGVITPEQIRKVCASAVEWAAPKPDGSQPEPPPESMPSPGLGIRHYAPRAQLVLIGGEASQQPRALLEALRQAAAANRSIGVMLPENFLDEDLDQSSGRVVIFNWGDWRNPSMLAHRLFAGLRELDASGVDVILCSLPATEGIGAAIHDRLRKAAKGR